MSYLTDTTEYIFGSLIFFLFSYVIVRLFDKTMLNPTANILSDTVNNIILKSTRKNDDIKTKYKDQVVEEEIEIHQEIQEDMTVYQDQSNLEVLNDDNTLNDEKQIKNKKKKIIKLDKNAVKGKFTRNLAQETFQNIRNNNLDQDLSPNDIKFNTGSMKKGSGRSM